MAGTQKVESETMKTLQEARESLQNFAESEIARKTLKELLTSTTNIALPSMVQAQALITISSWVDARDFALLKPIAPGTGKTSTTQLFGSKTYQDWTEGEAIETADPSLTKATATLKTFGPKGTLISDLLANTSAIDFVQGIGEVDGQAIRCGIFDKIVGALITVAGNSKSAASGSTLTMQEVADAIEANAQKGEMSDFIVTSPAGLWSAFTTNYAVTQFSGALSDMLVNGKIPNALGLQWYQDPYFVTTSDDNVLAVVGKKGRSVIWSYLTTEPMVELYREPLKKANTIVTSMEGGAIGAVANSVCKITPAS